MHSSEISTGELIWDWLLVVEVWLFDGTVVRKYNLDGK